MKAITSLTTLELYPTQMTDEVLRTLSELGWVHQVARASGEELGIPPRNPAEVVKLDLVGWDCHQGQIKPTPFTDVGPRDILVFTNLKSLDLTSSRITDTGPIELRNLKKLVDLDVSDIKVTSAGLQALEKALPDCEIKKSR